MSSSLPPRPITDVLPEGDRDQRRRRALADAAERLGTLGGVDPDSWAPLVAIEPYAEGAAVIALGGLFDRAGLEVLREVAAELERVAAEELVIDMSAMSRCDDAVARVVARWRIRRLAAGARVELHGTPASLRAELGQHPTAF